MSCLGIIQSTALFKIKISCSFACQNLSAHYNHLDEFELTIDLKALMGLPGSSSVYAEEPRCFEVVPESG